MRLPVAAVLFDFDYTLVDSSHGVHDCLNYALRKLGLPEAAYEAACRTIGLSLPDALVELSGPEEAARGEDFVRFFVERADEVMADECRVYATVPRVLESLDGLGMRLGIVSTKYRYRIEEVLERESLLDFFSVIVGGEDVPEHKPDPRSLLLAIAKIGVPAEGIVYVGDSVVDAETARRAAVDFVAVLTGVTDRREFDGIPRRAFLESLEELPTWLANETVR